MRRGCRAPAKSVLRACLAVGCTWLLLCAASSCCECMRGHQGVWVALGQVWEECRAVIVLAYVITDVLQSMRGLLTGKLT